jgi:hypothetical protein
MILVSNFDIAPTRLSVLGLEQKLSAVGLCHSKSRPGGVMVSMLATGPQGSRVKLGRDDILFKGGNNPQHAFLRRVSKAP